MSTITEELNRIKNAKSALKTALENKGIIVDSTATIDNYAAYVDSIATGGGSIPVSIVYNLSNSDSGLYSLTPIQTELDYTTALIWTNQNDETLSYIKLVPSTTNYVCYLIINMDLTTTKIKAYWNNKNSKTFNQRNHDLFEIGMVVTYNDNTTKTFNADIYGDGEKLNTKTTMYTNNNFSSWYMEINNIDLTDATFAKILSTYYMYDDL